MRKDSLGDRMKNKYETVTKTKLVSRMPVIIRIDGKAFHTFTRGFEKPFDYMLMDAMQSTMMYLCKNIQGCVLGYTQSDEISLLLVDYKKINSASWFDNEVRKICSVSASMATLAFNKVFEGMLARDAELDSESAEKHKAQWNAVARGALFDSRVFNVPREEVCNYFVWRQQDAIRNSIQSLGQAHFSHKELMNKNCEMIKKMVSEKGIEWDQLPFMAQMGSCAKKELVSKYVKTEDGKDDIHSREEWLMDLEIPVFSEEPEYINGLVYIDEN